MTTRNTDMDIAIAQVAADKVASDKTVAAGKVSTAKAKAAAKALADKESAVAILNSQRRGRRIRQSR